VSAQCFAGLMSGTSLDGVDAVLLQFDKDDRPRCVAHVHASFAPSLKAELFALNAPGEDEIARASLAGNALARVYAAAVSDLLKKTGRPAAEIAAIGCHGQTVRHRPELGYTVQIGNAALLAELTGIRVVADFRSRDVAAGGQGAPLAPAFHAAVFGDAAEDRAVLNLGGIANLSLLSRGDATLGFDTGPASCLLDLWASRHLGQPFDAAGVWAASAQPDGQLLARLLAEPYFALPPPKSTGRDLFNGDWLERGLSGAAAAPPAVVQATLLELTAQTIADGLKKHCPGVRRVIACGGGTGNTALLSRLRNLVEPVRVDSSAQHGIDPQHVEASAFAWLARRALQGAAGNLPRVTGARGPRVLGAIYPA
jgi:anhydro-N-acetylmuramic acid kinase